jgi:hypothetical protein
LESLSVMLWGIQRENRLDFPFETVKGSQWVTQLDCQLGKQLETLLDCSWRSLQSLNLSENLLNDWHSHYV